MKDAGPGEKVIRQLRDPSPGRAVLLTTPPERAAPEVDDPKTERAKLPNVCWHCVVCKEAGNNLPQPMPLFGDRVMPSLSHLLLNFLERRPHAVASGFPFDLELSAAACSADEGEAQEVEGLRFSEPPMSAALHLRSGRTRSDGSSPDGVTARTPSVGRTSLPGSGGHLCRA